MSRLSELIAELCPDGVEYKALGEVGTFAKGRGLQKKDFSETGIGCIHYGQIYTRLGIVAIEPLTYVSPEKAPGFTWVEPNDIVIAVTSENVDDVCKAVVWRGKDRIVTGAHAVVFHPFINSMYVAYYLQTRCFNQQKIMIVDGVKVIEMKIDRLAKVRIPVPPIEVQREIVRILDAFQELDDALTAEIGAREKQLGTLRKLRFSSLIASSTASTTIEAISKMVCSGGTPNRKVSAYYDGNIPWMRTQEVDFCDVRSTGMFITELGLKNSAAKWIPANCIVVAMYGATAGKVAVNKIPLTTNQACCNIQIDEDVADMRYVYHWLWSNYEVLKGLGEGSQGNINGAKVKGFAVPLPSLNIQRKLSQEFDEVLGLRDALRSERDARRKQFAYYRDKLLDFPKKVTT